MFTKFLKNNAGYSILETLCALVLLTAVLVPVCGLLSRLAVNHIIKIQYRKVNLARSVMEETLARSTFVNDSWQVTRDRKTWFVQRKCWTELSMVYFKIIVKQQNTDKNEYVLYACRPKSFYKRF